MHRRRIWRDGRPEIRSTQIDDVAFLTALLDQVEKDYAVDPKRVYVTGFSGGARVASGMGLASRDQVTGVAAFGAGLPNGARLPKEAGVLFFAGAGLDDFNLPEMRQLAADLDAAAIPNRLEIWDQASWEQYSEQQEQHFADLSEEILPGIL